MKNQIPLPTVICLLLSVSIVTRADESLGWRVGPTAWSFRMFTFFEAIEKTAALDMHFLEAYQEQCVSKDDDRRMDANLPDDAVAKLRAKLDAAKVKLTSIYIRIPGDETSCRRTFEFARRLGVETIVSEPAPESLPAIEKFCEEYRVNVALHNHPQGRSRYWHPREVLKACEGRGPRIGACGDTGHWLRSGIKPAEAVQILGRRLLSLHVKDLDEAMHDVPWGTGKGDIAELFRTLHRLRLTPTLFGIEYETKWENNSAEIEQCGKFFQQQVKNQPVEFKRTGWNAMAWQQFMHPPVLTYTRLAGASNYSCVVSWKDAQGGAQTRRLESASPEFDLAKIWEDLRPACGEWREGLPAHGSFQVSVEAVDHGGKLMASVVSSCQWKAPFKGPYRPAKCEYSESGAKTVACLLKKNLRGDGGSFPILMNSSYIRLLTTYVRVNPQGELAGQALAQARQYGQDMLRSSTPADWVYADMPMSHVSSYHVPSEHYTNMFQVGRGAMAGMAYLDLYAATHDQTWLDAALRIAATLKKNQSPEGRWPFRVEPWTGRVLEDYTSDQAEAILLLDELVWKHGQKDLQEALDKAVRWMLENPCKTFQWQQQWDDVGTVTPYGNLSWYDTALFIEYLLRHATPQNDYQALAGKLARYIEDQFVEWEPVENQITPGAREQYKCYAIIDWHCAHYIRVCMDFHARTKEDVWLKKARALADTLTVIQHPSGFYPTWMNHKPSKDAPGELKDICYTGLWPNCSSYSGEMLLRLGEHVKAAGAK